eukprot:SAG31_NODE_975_length_10623_cov_7.244964_13_plen_114_part_00
MRFNGINELGATVLGNVIEDPLCKLRELDLRCNNVSVDGAEALSHGLRSNVNLRRLDLGVNDICDEGCWELVRGRNCAATKRNFIFFVVFLSRDVLRLRRMPWRTMSGLKSLG